MRHNVVYIDLQDQLDVNNHFRFSQRVVVYLLRILFYILKFKSFTLCRIWVYLYLDKFGEVVMQWEVGRLQNKRDPPENSCN